MRTVKRSWWGGALWSALVATLLLSACAGGDDGTAPDLTVARFVGDWSASAFVLTSVANPDVHPDLIALGATFSLNVQPSGQYTAILLYAGDSLTELGRIEVSGSTVVLNRDFPNTSTSSSTFTFQGTNTLVLDGDSEFDFNLDGTAEPARAHLVLAKK